MKSPDARQLSVNVALERVDVPHRGGDIGGVEHVQTDDRAARAGALEREIVASRLAGAGTANGTITRRRGGAAIGLVPRRVHGDLRMERDEAFDLERVPRDTRQLVVGLRPGVVEGDQRLHVLGFRCRDPCIDRGEVAWPINHVVGCNVARDGCVERLVVGAVEHLRVVIADPRLEPEGSCWNDGKDRNRDDRARKQQTGDSLWH